MWFSQRFRVEPPPEVPFKPSSGSQLVEYVPSGITDNTTTGTQDSCQIGVGSLTSNPSFRWDFFGMMVGCDLREGEDLCRIRVSGYRFNAARGSEERIMSQDVWVRTCNATSGCDLRPVVVNGFTNISSVVLSATVDSQPRVWWCDDFDFGWTDNSCVGAMGRQNAPAQMSKRKPLESFSKWTPSGVKRVEAGGFVSSVRGLLRM